MKASISKTHASRINKLAHRLAQQHESAIRGDLMQRVLDARTAGASFDDLNRLLDERESALLDDPEK